MLHVHVYSRDVFQMNDCIHGTPKVVFKLRNQIQVLILLSFCRTEANSQNAKKFKSSMDH